MIYREKMICGILLLLSLTSCVSAVDVEDVTTISPRSEDLTEEWMNTTKPDTSLDYFCTFTDLIIELRLIFFTDLLAGVSSLHKQYAGQMPFGEDFFKERQFKSNMTRLRISDSGLYVCEVLGGHWNKQFQLNATVVKDRLVAAERNQPQSLRANRMSDETDPPSADSGSQPRPAGILLYCGLILTAAALLSL